MLLGLALASKWVGAYAIGRSSCSSCCARRSGRVIALVGHDRADRRSSATSAIAPRPTTVGPAPQLHVPGPDAGPDACCSRSAWSVGRVRFTRDELRLAVVGPVVARRRARRRRRRAAGPAPTRRRLVAAPEHPLLLGRGPAAAAGGVAYGIVVARRRVGRRASGAGHAPIGRREPRPRRHRRAAGCRPGRACWACRGCSRWLPHGHPAGASTSLSYVPWVELGNQLDRRAARPGNGGQTLVDLTAVDVRVPRRPARRRTPRRRRGGRGRSTSSRSGSTRTLRRPHDRGHLRHRQPGHLLAGDPGRRLRPRGRLARRSLSLTLVVHRHLRACGCPGRASTGPRSSTTSSPACRSSFWRSPTSSPSCGTALRSAPGCSRASPAALAHPRGAAAVAAAPPLCGLAGTEAVQPEAPRLCARSSRDGRPDRHAW